MSYNTSANKNPINIDVLIDKLASVDWSFRETKSFTGLYHIDEVHNLHWYPGTQGDVFPPFH